MKKIGVYTILTLLIFTAIIFVIRRNGFNSSDEEMVVPQKGKSGSLTIIDHLGREVSVKTPINRIAFSHFSTGEALKILNAWDLVAGRSRNLDKNIFPNLPKIPIITGQGVYDLNYEKIFDLKIDLFLAINISMDGFDEMISRLEPDIPVVVLNFDELETFKEELVKLGILLGKQEEAMTYLKWFDGIVANMSIGISSLSKINKPTVFFKTSWGSPDDIQTFTDVSPGITERNRITGCINAAGKLPSSSGWIQTVNTEWLATQDIDILIGMDIIHNGFGIGINDNTIVRNHRKKVMNHPAFSASIAVKNSRVYIITGAFFGTPRFIVGFAYMAKWFHPEIFKDFNPRKIHQDYLNRFMRIDYDLNKQGVFVYPDV